MQQVESVPHEIKLNFFIQRAVCAEGWQLVDFNQPGLQRVVNENVVAVALKAVLVIQDDALQEYFILGKKYNI